MAANQAAPLPWSPRAGSVGAADGVEPLLVSRPGDCRGTGEKDGAGSEEGVGRNTVGESRGLLVEVNMSESQSRNSRVMSNRWARR